MSLRTNASPTWVKTSRRSCRGVATRGTSITSCQSSAGGAGDPQHHDWPAARNRIYDLVFGPSQVRNMTAFDDTLVAVKSLFVYPWRPAKWRPVSLPRLRCPDDRPAAQAMLNELERLGSKIERRATTETILDPQDTQTRMLDAMRREIEAGKAAARLSHPRILVGRASAPDSRRGIRRR